MTTFVLRKLDAVVGRQQFFELVAGNSQFDSFCEEIRERKQYYSELLKIFTLMDLVSQLKMLPKTKFRDITPKNETVKEYEFKSKHLRIYAIQKTNGKIVILGGYKNNQNKDFLRFRSLKKQLLASLNYKL